MIVVGGLIFAIWICDPAITTNMSSEYIVHGTGLNMVFVDGQQEGVAEVLCIDIIYFCANPFAPPPSMYPALR